MGKTDSVSPITSSNWDNSQFGKDDSSTNGSSNFLCAFDSKSNVTIIVSNNDKSLKSSSLTGSSLFLDGHDLHDFILKFGSQKPIDNLILFDGKSK